MILAGLDCYEVFVSVGSACTADRVEPSHVLLGMGISSEEALTAVRFSFGSTTSPSDIEYALHALNESLKKGIPHGLAFMPPEHLTAEVIQSKDVFIIDLRFPYERMLSPTISGAKEWSHIYFDRYIKRIPTDKKVILICSTGIFSMMAGYRLARSGHREVYVVHGGYSAWEAIYPDKPIK